MVFGWLWSLPMIEQEDRPRDLGSLVVSRVGSLVETGDPFEPYRLVVDPGVLAGYGDREQTRTDHLREVMSYAGWRTADRLVLKELEHAHRDQIEESKTHDRRASDLRKLSQDHS